MARRPALDDEFLGVRMRLSWLLLALTLLLPRTGAARTMEPGMLWGSAAVGPSFRLGSALGGSKFFLMADVRGEYTLSKNISGVADLGVGNFGFIGTAPLRLRAGARYRLSDLDLPISPFAQAQLSVGKLFDVIGANLTTLGVRLGGGADYFLTADLAIGGLLAMDFSSTFGDRPAFFGTFEVMVHASYALF